MESNSNFTHGGNIKAFSKKIKCKEEEIIDLSSNINFLKPKIKKDFNKLEISSYPTYENLNKKISKKYKIKADELEIFNGGSSAIFSLFKHLKLEHCTIYSPAYLEYKKAATIFDYKVDLINRYENIYKEVKEDSLVIFVNPSTPDGKYYDLEKLVTSWIKKNATILIDESFLDFCEKESLIKYLKKYDKLYILKSMTKFYSSASIRIGILISSIENIKKLKEKEPLWKVSHFDSIYLQNALNDKLFSKKTIKITAKLKNELINKLKIYSFIKEVFDSDANFIMVKLNKTNARKLQKRLNKYKIMIRDCSNFDYLDDTYVRIAIKEKSKMEILIEAFNEIEKRLK